jgi:hypothetical protein
MAHSYQVFISFKNSDAQGLPTRDGQLADLLYRDLTSRGLMCSTAIFPYPALERPSTRSAYIERYNRSYRTKVLNAWLFESLVKLRAGSGRATKNGHTTRWETCPRPSFASR